MLHGTKTNKTTKARYSLRLIYRKSANSSNAFIDEINQKIKNKTAFQKMNDTSRYDNPN